MTGSDIELWLDGIRDDLLNLDTADILILLLKLTVLWIVLFFAWQLGRGFIKVLWKAAKPVLLILWKIGNGSGLVAMVSHKKTVQAD